MRRSTPDIYTILISRTGQLPITLMVRPKALLVLITVALVSPFAWLGGRLYLLNRHNQELAKELSAQNQLLDQAADDVFKELAILDAELKMLRERAGLSEDDVPVDVDGNGQTSRLSGQPPQGGTAQALEPDETFEHVKERLPELTSALDQQIRPALDVTLAKEFARTNAVPSIRPVGVGLRISSKFGIRRNPFGWGFETHNGLDFAGPLGASIYATAPGKITKAEWGSGYGYHVVIDHGYGYETLYAHLAEFKVAVGDRIERNEILGLMGNTGRSTGTHLHYEVYKDGKLVDPEDYLD